MLQNKVYITREFSFEASHKLLGYDGPCSNLHGHSYRLQVTVSGHVIPMYDQTNVSDCMVLDFKNLDEIVQKAIISTHDHRYLNDIYHNPTAEVMVVNMFYTLDQILPKDVKLERVKLWETSNSFAEYKGETNHD